MEPLEIVFEVACGREHAFDVWANRTSLWWPRDHTASGESLASITYEPRVGGRIFERADDGTEHDWGEVLAWEPPARLLYLWHIAADRSEATEVEVTFRDAGEATVVTIRHGGWDGLGADAEQRRTANRHGWAAVIEAFSPACAS